MRKLIQLLFLSGLIILLNSCSIFKGHLSQSQTKRLDKVFIDSPSSLKLLLEEESLLKIDSEVIYPKEVKKELRKLDLVLITDVKIYSNSKTVEEQLEDTRSELIVISTTNKTSDSNESENGYDLITSSISEWLDTHPNPMIVIDGRLFRYESEYKPFLQELNKKDIESIEILKDASAIRVLNYKSVILLTTKQRK